MSKKLVLKGIGASAGMAQGRVRIIHGATDTKEFQKGEVLVTVMTDPTMVIMMGKAAAIVTDTGGLTCHAAIVSREMGIPSIVATKNATKMLQTGDEVLVDGKTGEIFFIK